MKRAVRYAFKTNRDDVSPLDLQPGASLNTPPIEGEFVVEQALEYYCKAVSQQVGQPNIEFYLYR